jgi:hypothetical protein
MHFSALWRLKTCLQSAAEVIGTMIGEIPTVVERAKVRLL